MSKLLKKSLVFGLLVSVLLPSVTFARERNAITLKKAEDARATAQAARLDPYSAENEAILKELEITLQPVDPIWQNPKFAEFMALMKEAKVYEAQEDIASLVLTVIEAWKVAEQINHPALGQFTNDPEQKKFFQNLETAINNDPEFFAENPEAVLFSEVFRLVGEALVEGLGELEKEFGLENVYGYSEPGGIIYTDEVVYLRVNQPYLEDLKVTWRQVYGPEVNFLPINRANETAFRVPRDAKGKSMSFEYTLRRFGQSRTGRINMTVNQDPYKVFVPASDEITELYHSLLGRNPDQPGYHYWKTQYDNGMTLDEIRREFIKSDEYQRLHR